MDDQQIKDIADRLIAALEQLAPGQPSGWTIVASMAPVAALIAAVIAGLIGWRNLKQQQRALRESVKSNAKSLSQKRQADARSEWWKRTQWALEAAASDDPRMYAYGTGMLDLLAQSELAGPKDKELLDAVWEGTDTEMRDEGIKQLIKDAREQEDLSYEELLSLMSFGPDDVEAMEQLREQAKGISVEDMEMVLKQYQAMDAAASQDEASDDAATTETDGWFNRLRSSFRRSSTAEPVDGSSARGNNVKDSKEEEDGDYSEKV